MKRLVIVLFMACCVGFSSIEAKSSCNNEIENVEQSSNLEGVWVLENADLEEVKPDNSIVKVKYQDVQNIIGCGFDTLQFNAGGSCVLKSKYIIVNSSYTFDNDSVYYVSNKITYSFKYGFNSSKLVLTGRFEGGDVSGMWVKYAIEMTFRKK